MTTEKLPHMFGSLLVRGQRSLPIALKNTFFTFTTKSLVLGTAMGLLDMCNDYLGTTGVTKRVVF